MPGIGISGILKRKKVLILGDSFSRDFANILFESKYRDQIKISYFFPHKSEDFGKIEKRIRDADFIFFGFSSPAHDVPRFILDHVPRDKLYVVGTKNFGASNGIIYNRRGLRSYYSQTVQLDSSLIRVNDNCQKKYGERYINLIKKVQDASGNVRVFTDDKKLISQDCRHLTPEGAKYYSRILDLSFLLK